MIHFSSYLGQQQQQEQLKRQVLTDIVFHFPRVSNVASDNSISPLRVV